MKAYLVLLLTVPIIGCSSHHDPQLDELVRERVLDMQKGADPTRTSFESSRTR